MRYEHADRWSDESPVALTCRSCGTAHPRGLEDGECDPCLGRDSYDLARVRESIRALHASTALLLRKMGFLERAAVHDAESER